jgi:hypothetical protein
MAPSQHNNITQHFSVCPLCDQKYGNVRMTLVQQSEQRSGLHITCPHCKGSVIVFMAPGPGGVMSVGMVTDLDRHEVDAKLTGAPITDGDILDVYEELHNKNVTILDILTQSSQKKKNI